MTIGSLSPRNTAPNHTLTSSPSRTWPMTHALGAIQHLPDPGKGFGRLAEVLVQGASIFVWVYGKRRGLYRLIDVMRPLTTRMPMSILYRVTQVLNIVSFLCFSLPYAVLRRLPGGARLAGLLPFTRYADLLLLKRKR